MPLLRTQSSYWETSTLMWAMTVRPGEMCDWEEQTTHLNPSGIQLLDFCAIHSSSITNTMFRWVVRKCTWHQDALALQSMIDFVVVSSDLQPYVLDTQVKRGAERSIDPLVWI